jgi:uncharacterized protein
MIDASFSGSEIALHSAPIKPSWLLSGTPVARNNAISKSRDGTAYTMVWDCTAGSFTWSYDCDETFYVIEGTASLTTRSGKRDIGPGSVVFFPAGSEATWQVDAYIRKVAFVRQTVPTAVGFALRLWRRITTLWISDKQAEGTGFGTDRIIPISTYMQPDRSQGNERQTLRTTLGSGE